MKIGVMGTKGSFSEQAGKIYAKNSLKHKKISIEYLITADMTMKALDDSDIDVAVLALENSTMGVIQSSIYAMAKYRFTIQKVFSIDVPHCLIVKRGVAAGTIREIVSQNPALLQCKEYLKRRWPKLKLREYDDTAKAAEDLANGTLPPTCAVIASRAAAKAYGLAILEDAIQDSKDNTTTFIAIEKLKK